MQSTKILMNLYNGFIGLYAKKTWKKYKYSVLKNTIFILLQTCFFLRYLNEQDEENSKTNLLI